MAGFIDNAGEFTLLDSWILLKKHSSTTTIYSITWLNRNSRGQLFYFGLEIFQFKKSTVKTKIKGPADYLQFNKIMLKRG